MVSRGINNNIRLVTFYEFFSAQTVNHVKIISGNGNYLVATL